MARQLKVFSTAAGFVNAVVAAPSQKAALEAWGVRDNLFASGAATVVTDPDLIAQALATPGEIVRVPISTDAGFLAAAKPPPAAASEASKTAAPKASVTSAPPAARAPRFAPPPPPPPPPDRSALTRAERALQEAQTRQRETVVELDAERDAYERRRAEAEVELKEAVSEAQRARDLALEAFKAAGGS